jgi:spermidine synthase
MVRILLITALIFFIPSCLLGMVSPVVVKLTLGNLEKTGSLIGRIYAVSTLGSISGTLATGFFLISWLGTRNLLFATGVLLFFAASLFGGFFVRRTRIVVLVLLLPFLGLLYHYGFSPLSDETTLFFKESNYYTIRLKGNPERSKGQLITLYLDQLTHSCSDPDDPLRLQYRYIRGYKELLQWQADRRGSFKALFIGGGGYTFPRFIEATYPKAAIEVVEIDPVVTQVSQKYLGVSQTSKIQTFNEDARWFIMNRKGEGEYDYIFEDAFNDLSIPYHLTTREFAVEMKRLLKNNGLLLTNVIDRFEKGSFLPSYILTLEEVFGKGNVHLVTLGPAETYAGVTNRIVVTSPQKIDIEDLVNSLNRMEEAERISHVMPQKQLQNYLDRFRPVVLTDDYVPVDNLTAANFR